MTDRDGLGGMFNMENLMRMAQDMQKRMQEVQQEMANLTATAASGGGLVTVTVNGNHRITSLKMDPEVASEDLEILQDLTAAAINMAMEKVDQEIKEKMGEVTGGLQLPFPIPGLGG